MTVELAIALTTLLVEDEHLVALYEGRYHLAYHLSTRYSRSTYSNGTILVYKEYLVELYHCATLCALNVVNKQATALLYLELLSLNVYDNVHCYT